MEVKVWVWVIIVKENTVLLWKRKNSHWDNTWCFPGWHLDFKESWVNCAIRETLEETNISIENITHIATTNDIFEKENKHYVTIYMKSDYKSGEVTLMEPDKCEWWNWFEINNLPTPLFLPIQNLLKEKRNLI